MLTIILSQPGVSFIGSGGTHALIKRRAPFYSIHKLKQLYACIRHDATPGRNLCRDPKLCLRKRLASKANWYAVALCCDSTPALPPTPMCGIRHHESIFTRVALSALNALAPWLLYRANFSSEVAGLLYLMVLVLCSVLCTLAQTDSIFGVSSYGLLPKRTFLKESYHDDFCFTHVFDAGSPKAPWPCYAGNENIAETSGGVAYPRKARVSRCYCLYNYCHRSPR